MEQIVLYLAVLAALSGFGMGMFNLAGPFLKRHNITLPSLSLASLTGRLKRGAAEDEFDLNLDDMDDVATARDFAESSFAPDTSLLARRRDALEDGEEELDEELAGVLDQVAEEPYGDGDDEEREPGDEEDLLEDADEGTVIYRVAAESDEEAEDDELIEEEDEPSDEDETDEDEDEEDDGTEEEEPQAEVQVAAAGGGEGGDMMSFFNEAADAGAGAVAPWREDLPEVSIDELLAEARALSQQIRGKKSNAA